MLSPSSLAGCWSKSHYPTDASLYLSVIMFLIISCILDKMLYNVKTIRPHGMTSRLNFASFAEKCVISSLFQSLPCFVITLYLHNHILHNSLQCYLVITYPGARKRLEFSKKSLLSSSVEALCSESMILGHLVLCIKWPSIFKKPVLSVAVKIIYKKI